MITRNGFTFDGLATIIDVISPKKNYYQVELNTLSNKFSIYKVIEKDIDGSHWTSYKFVDWYEGANELLAGDEYYLDCITSAILRFENKMDGLVDSIMRWKSECGML